MANSVDELVGEFNSLVSTLQGMQEQGQEPGQTSLTRAVDVQIGILSNALHRSKVDCDALMYGKKYGSLEPEQVSSILYKMANAIDKSKSPRRDLVIEDIKKVIASLG
jgi:hypothetical protein